ncbi:MAG: hypothetical protein M0T78_09690 [Actinomycetota bacterium]|nr:hypothetical protein [Actinomycetota bacterium]
MIDRIHRFRPTSISFLALMSMIVASCGSSAVSLPPPSTTQRLSTPTSTSSFEATSTTFISRPQGQRVSAKWVLTSNVLKVIAKNQSIYPKIASEGVIEVTPIDASPLLGVGVVPAVKFTSVKSLVQAIQSGALPTWAKAVIYDPEYWALTPTTEQSDPVTASSMASVAARQAGLIYVVTPALDLTKALAPNTAPNGQSLIEMGLYGKLAKAADVIVIQSQSLEGNLPAYSSLLSQSSSQARSANPNIDVLGGLSTNLRSASLGLINLTSAYSSGLTQVNGYWFNVPGKSIQCPTCSQANFQLAMSFFEAALT